MNRTRLAVLAAITGTMAGCSAWDNNLSQGVEDPCALVQDLVADFPEGFESYRGKANNTRGITTYRATEDLVAGHCEIWQWGNNDTAYSCSATADSLEQAQTRYLNSVTFLMQCLGPNWTNIEMSRDRDGEAAGQLTRFTSEQHPQLSVSVHLIDDQRGPGQRYSNYLYLGNEARTSELP